MEEIKVKGHSNIRIWRSALKKKIATKITLNYFAFSNRVLLIFLCFSQELPYLDQHRAFRLYTKRNQGKAKQFSIFQSHSIFLFSLQLTRLPYKLFQVLLMELFWFELPAPGFIFLFSLPRVQGGVSHQEGMKSQEQIWTFWDCWVLTATLMCRIQHEQKLQSHQREKLLHKISVLMQERSPLGHRLSFVGSLSLSWCII